MSNDLSSEKIVLNTDDEAAKPHTMSGWLSRSGRFYGPNDERLARYDGSTHHKCECGNLASKSYTCCTDCQVKHAHEQWLKLPLIEWDGETPLSDGDNYFFDSESVYEHCEMNDLKIGDLDLVTCEPNYAREIDTDYFCDELPEDGDVPPALEAAMEIFNAAVRATGALSWFPGKHRVILPEIENDE